MEGYSGSGLARLYEQLSAGWGVNRPKCVITVLPIQQNGGLPHQTECRPSRLDYT